MPWYLEQSSPVKSRLRASATEGSSGADRTFALNPAWLRARMLCKNTRYVMMMIIIIMMVMV